MTINRNNYEIYFLDFFEGNLDAKLVNELMLFLDLNYDLKEEFDAFENSALPLEKKVIFPDKEKLKKSTILSFGFVTAENYQEKLISALEGDLSSQELEELDQFILLNPFIKKEQLLFAKTLVNPDNSIVFENKTSLKRNVIKVFAGITEENYQERIIDFYEGILAKVQQQELDGFLRINPFLQKEFELFAKAKLEPDTEIIFDRKDQMKKADATVYKLRPVESENKVFNFRKILYPLSVAASIAIVLSIYFAMNKSTFTQGKQTARNVVFDFNRAIENVNHQDIDQKNNIQYVNKNVSVKNTNLNAIDRPEHMHAIGYTAIAGSVKQYPTVLEEQETYSELYDIIKKRLDNKENAKEKSSNKFYTLDQFALYNVKKSLKPKSERNKVRPDEKISLWDLADVGVRGFNHVTGADAKLTHDDNASFSLALNDKFALSRSKGEKK